VARASNGFRATGRLRDARMREGLDLTEFAARVGMDRSNLSKVERGLTVAPPATAQRIAEGLNLTLDEAVGRKLFTVVMSGVDVRGARAAASR